MSHKTPERGYSIETVADAVFSLERSPNDADQIMAANYHSYKPKAVITAARVLAKAKLASIDAC